MAVNTLLKAIGKVKILAIIPAPLVTTYPHCLFAQHYYRSIIACTVWQWSSPPITCIRAIISCGSSFNASCCVNGRNKWNWKGKSALWTHGSPLFLTCCKIHVTMRTSRIYIVLCYVKRGSAFWRNDYNGKTGLRRISCDYILCISKS